MGFLYALPGKLVGGLSGLMLGHFGYPLFFVFTAAIGIPGTLLCLYVGAAGLLRVWRKRRPASIGQRAALTARLKLSLCAQPSQNTRFQNDPALLRSDVSGFHKRAGTERIWLVRAGMMSAARAARLGYSAFQGNRRVKVAGAANAMLAGSVPFVPRAMTLWVARLLLSA